MSTLAPIRPPPANPPMALAARVADRAARRPDATALRRIGEGEEMTYARFWDAARVAADQLLRLDADRRVVLLCARNGFPHPIWLCAALLGEARLVMAHASLTPAELAEIAGASGASLLVRSSDPAVPLAHAAMPHPRPIRASVVLRTSGTTGRQRLVIRDDASLLADAANIATAAMLSPGDRALCAMPLSHSYGIDFIVASLFAGATIDIADGFDLPRIQAHLAAGHATVVPGVPFMFDALARGCAAPFRRPPRLAFSAGTALPERVRRLAETSCGLRVGELYGATELGSVTLNAPGSSAYAPGCAGPAFGGVSIRILDPEDPSRILPAGDEGQVCVDAPSMLTAYADGPRRLIDGHFPTGDLGRLDSSGRLTITGRLKLLIDAGGLKVNPLEVESVFSEHPGVADCAALPLPLSDTVTKIRLRFVPADPSDPPRPDELRAFARPRLAPFKMPRVFEPCRSLPRTPNGKLLRHLIGDGA